MGTRESMAQFASQNVGAAARSVAALGGRGSTAPNEPPAGVCRNCGRTEDVTLRRLVPDESCDGNEVELCGDCAGRRESHSGRGAETAPERRNRCRRETTGVDREAVVERDGGRCRGCGVREAIVVGDRLHCHPVVPLSDGGHRHVHNFVSLCPICHERVHDGE